MLVTNLRVYQFNNNVLKICRKIYNDNEQFILVFCKILPRFLSLNEDGWFYLVSRVISYFILIRIGQLLA